MVDRDKGDKPDVRMTMRPTTTCAECRHRERRDGVTGRDRAQRPPGDLRPEWRRAGETQRQQRHFARNRERLKGQSGWLVRLVEATGEAGPEVEARAQPGHDRCPPSAPAPKAAQTPPAGWRRENRNPGYWFQKERWNFLAQGLACILASFTADRRPLAEPAASEIVTKPVPRYPVRFERPC